MHERKVEGDRGCGLGVEMVLQQARPRAGNEGHSWWLKGAVLKVEDDGIYDDRDSFRRCNGETW